MTDGQSHDERTSAMIKMAKRWNRAGSFEARTVLRTSLDLELLATAPMQQGADIRNWAQVLVEVMPSTSAAEVRAILDGLAETDIDRGLGTLLVVTQRPARPQEPNWVMRNKLLAALILVVLVVLASPEYASHIPPEVREFLGEDEGPAAFCMTLVACVTAAMAVNNSKNKKD